MFLFKPTISLAWFFLTVAMATGVALDIPLWIVFPLYGVGLFIEAWLRDVPEVPPCREGYRRKITVTHLGGPAGPAPVVCNVGFDSQGDALQFMTELNKLLDHRDAQGGFVDFKLWGAI